MMTHRMPLLLVLLAGLLALAAAAPIPPAHAAEDRNIPTVIVAKIAASINPVTADYLSEAVAHAEKERAALLVVELDTPGGLDTAMRQMVQEIFQSKVPVAVYVHPPGARAASAGVMITLAADIAAMAPGTNIGAAHPVGMGGGEMDNTMAAKVVEDAAAYARTIAERKGRNADWAEDAVRKSASLPAEGALAKKVIDLVAPTIPALLAEIDGRTVLKEERTITIRVKEARIAEYPMGWRHSILATLADPNVAYILLMVGVYGLFFELANPGAIFPGVIGGISLILGFYSLHTLSANYAGFLLIALSLLMFILELKVPSYGALTIGGIVSLFLGSLMLFRTSTHPYLRISWSVLLTMVLLSATFFSTAILLAVRSQLRGPFMGGEGLVGETGEALYDFTERGKVFVAGEMWEADSLGPLRKGDRVTVVRREGMRLVVKAKESPPSTGS
jgi:membrane-bound serine protease (ClpP class)